MMNPKSAPVVGSVQEANDIFSISDQVLADRLQFIEEVRLSTQSIPHQFHSSTLTLNCYVGLVGLMMLTGEMVIDWLWQLGKRLGVPSQTRLFLLLPLLRLELAACAGWRDDDCGQARP